MRGNTAEPTPAASARESQATSPAFNAMQSFSFTPADFDLGAAAVEAHGDLNHDSDATEPHGVSFSDPMRVAPLTAAPLSFGYGALLRDGAGEADFEDDMYLHTSLPEEVEGGGKTLRGRYIVRVGWDDVRGWLGEGGTLIGSSRCPSCKWAW